MSPKVIFWGSPDFSLPALQACKAHSQILAVISQPDKERGRGHEVLPTPVKEWALKEGLPVFTPKSLRKVAEETEKLLEFLKNNSADFFVVVAYGNLLPDSVLSMPLKACVNIHASLLPRWRGAAPIQRSLEFGDEETGVSLQRMVKELDAGDVYLEKKYKILEDDNAQSLFQKLALMGGELITEFLQKDFASLVPVKQDVAHVTLAPKIDKKEALWNSSWTAKEFHNKVRAFSFWPTVKMSFANAKEKLEVKILKTQRLGKQSFGTSEVFGIANDIAFVRDSQGAFLQILLAQLPGKGPTEGVQVFKKLISEGFQAL